MKNSTLCFLVDTLLIICYASYGIIMYDDPLPPEPPPSFVLLTLLLCSVLATMDTLFCVLSEFMIHCFTFARV